MQLPSRMDSFHQVNIPMLIMGGCTLFELEKGRLYKSPTAAVLWSMCCPGFGQIYNGDYILGLILMACEGVVNVKSGLNISLYHAFNGHVQMSLRLANEEWALFYPPLYSFDLANAYNRAKQINHALEAQGVSRSFKSDYHHGFFIGLAFGMVFGMIWGSPLVGPVFGGLGLGVVGAIVGLFVERMWRRSHKRNES